MRRETGMDAQVKHIALTNEQVAQYHLPRGLNTTNNKTQQQFSDEYGGFVELDAFVGKHMHVFRQLVKDELDRFYDHDLDTHGMEIRERIVEEIQERLNELKVSPE